MDLHRFQRAGLRATPWKNGGGSTCEIACWPPGAGLDDFDWRASIATIAASGPFSEFPGVDRVIMLLDGDGVRLRSADGAIDHRLDRPWAPFAFPGERALDCERLGGASSDFNVMVRRGRLRAELDLVREARALAPAPHGLLLALRGRWTLQLSSDRQRPADPLVCQAGEGLWWADAALATRAEPGDPDAALLAVRFRPCGA